MARGEKKVIVFIVEGASDEAALGTIMKEYFAGNETRFLVVHGDITIKDYVTLESIVAKINERIEDIQNRYRYQTSDILKIIHLSDTDGVFIEDQYVQYADVNSLHYYTNHMETNLIEAVIQRNHNKAQVLFKLRKTSKINGISYRIYYNSCNLEHVLYNELKDFTNEEKQIMSDEFAEKYDGNVEGFIKFISDSDMAVSGTYQQSWNFIEKGVNSLNRHTNINLLFDGK